jgi:hypothetical protein
VVPNGSTIVIVGLASDVQLNAGPTLFVAYPDYVRLVRAVNPDAGVPLPNVLVAALDEGVSADELVVGRSARRRAGSSPHFSSRRSSSSRPVS